MADLDSNDFYPQGPGVTGNLVPLRRDPAGHLHLAVPGAVHDAVNSIYDLATAPAKAAQGKYTPAQLQDTGSRMALTMMGLGLGLPGEENALKMFGGVRARTANMPQLIKALSLEGQGAEPEHIWNQTGWFRGPDSKWRFEIPDEAAKLQHAPTGNDHILDPSFWFAQHGDSVNLADMISHRQLFNAYPELQSMKVSGGEETGGGAYWPSSGKITLGPASPGNLLSNTLHEGQHSVQDIEGFAEGGSPEQFLTPEFQNQDFIARQNMGKIYSQMQQRGLDPMQVSLAMQRFAAGKPMGDAYEHMKTAINTAPDLMDQYRDTFNEVATNNAIKNAAMDKYRSLAGEAEAFNVQERHATGDYGTFPPATPGYLPFDKQIVIVNGQEQPRLAIPVDHDPWNAPALASVEHDPWLHTAEPVSHDPFATTGGPNGQSTSGQ